MLLGLIGPHAAMITPRPEHLVFGDLPDESILIHRHARSLDHRSPEFFLLVHLDRLQWKQRGPALLSVVLLEFEQRHE